MSKYPEYVHTKSREWFDRALNVIPSGIYGHLGPTEGLFLPLEKWPLISSKAKGTYFWDMDGNKYLDLMCAYGPNVLGYGDPDVDRAAMEQMLSGNCTTAPSYKMVECAEMLVDTVACADWAFFMKNGTDATTFGILTARAATGRKKTLFLKGYYHGNQPWAMKAGYPGILPEEVANNIIVPWFDLDALEKAKEPTLSDLLVDYFNLRNEQRNDWSGKAKLKCTVRDFEEVKQAVDYLKAHSLNTIEDLDTAISNLNQTTAPLRRQLKQNENRMRAIAQIKDAAAVHAKLKPVHDTFIKKNFKLTKDAYAAQHKDELDAFNKAVRTLMKLNGSTAVDFSALDAEFSALQSSSAEFRTQLETLQPDISDLKSVRKYIDMVLNKQQLFAPGGKTPEKESVLKKLEQFQQKKSHHKTTSTPPNREESL